MFSLPEVGAESTPDILESWISWVELFGNLTLLIGISENYDVETLRSPYLMTCTLELLPTVTVWAAAVAAPRDVIAPVSSLSSAVVVALVIPVATETTPVPAVAPVLRLTEGCAVTATAVAAVPVVAVPSPVMTVPPPPLEERLPVATVFAVPRVTLDAVSAVPSVGAVPFPPLMMRVSASSPVPMANPHVDAVPALVTLGMVTSAFPVTLGTVVVASLLVAPGYDLTKVSVDDTPTVVPLAVALMLVVAGVTVVLNVASVPRTKCVLCAPKETDDGLVAIVVSAPKT